MKYPLPKSPAAIEFTLDFEEHLARKHAGISVLEYEKLPGDPRWCTEDAPVSKAELLVAYRIHNQITAISEHIATKNSKRR